MTTLLSRPILGKFLQSHFSEKLPPSSPKHGTGNLPKSLWQSELPTNPEFKGLEEITFRNIL